MESLDAVFPAGVHHDLGPQDIGLQEDARVLDGAIHVGFGGEIHHHIRFLCFEYGENSVSIPDILFVEFEVWVLQRLVQRMEISGIGQRVDAHNSPFRPFIQ